MDKNTVQIGDVYWVDFKGEGSEQSGLRPAIVVQNNIGNKYSPTVKVVPVTTQVKKRMPTHVIMKAVVSGLEKDSIALCEQETVCDKSKIKDYITTLPKDIMKEIAIGMSINTPVITYLSKEDVINLLFSLQMKNNLNQILA